MKEYSERVISYRDSKQNLRGQELKRLAQSMAEYMARAEALGGE